MSDQTAVAVAEGKADARQERNFQHSWLIVGSIGSIAVVACMIFTLVITWAMDAGGKSARLDLLCQTSTRHSDDIAELKADLRSIKSTTDLMKDWLANTSKKVNAKDNP